MADLTKFINTNCINFWGFVWYTTPVLHLVCMCLIGQQHWSIVSAKLNFTQTVQKKKVMCCYFNNALWIFVHASLCPVLLIRTDCILAFLWKVDIYPFINLLHHSAEATNFSGCHKSSHISCIKHLTSPSLTSSGTSGAAFWCSLEFFWMFTVKTRTKWSFPPSRTSGAGCWRERKSDFFHKTCRRHSEVRWKSCADRPLLSATSGMKYPQDVLKHMPGLITTNVEPKMGTQGSTSNQPYRQLIIIKLWERESLFSICVPGHCWLTEVALSAGKWRNCVLKGDQCLVGSCEAILQSPTETFFPMCCTTLRTCSMRLSKGKPAH